MAKFQPLLIHHRACQQSQTFPNRAPRWVLIHRPLCLKRGILFIHHLYEVSTATLTSHRRPSSLKHQSFQISQFWRSEVQGALQGSLAQVSQTCKQTMVLASHLEALGEGFTSSCIRWVLEFSSF